MQSLYCVVVSSPGLGSPTLVTVEPLASRIIGLIWQVSDRCVTCCLATSDRHVATSDPHVATSDPHVATSDPHVATSDPHVATSDPHVATSDHHVATSDPPVATSDCHIAISDRHVATSDRHVVPVVCCVYSRPQLYTSFSSGSWLTNYVYKGYTNISTVWLD